MSNWRDPADGKYSDCILTQFAFRRKMLYLCKSEAGLSIGKFRFLNDFQAFLLRISVFLFRKFPVLHFKFQVFVLKFRYGLFELQYLEFGFCSSEMLWKVKNVNIQRRFFLIKM